MEQGSHAELIAKENGAYAVLVSLQMSALGKKTEDDPDQEAADDDEDLVRRSPSPCCLESQNERAAVPAWVPSERNAGRQTAPADL